ncbi:T-complex protein 1 subunit beta-like [Labeo rohita]|uniref:T-complex protein 1 subunit beta-like n=1 Tax=Labeo rohita TaxID=84645 RepID=UPI0021E242A9|nr:T-complex protein 1 subunit beta-like [Labeo rohita]
MDAEEVKRRLASGDYVLAKLARSVLHIPASRSSSERVFGAAGRTISCDHKNVPGSPFRFHRFPVSDIAMRQLWLVAIGYYAGAKISSIKDFRVCSAHFSEDDYIPDQGGKSKKRILKSSAVPVPWVKNTKTHKEFRDHVVHAVEQYRKQELKIKNQEKELQRKLTQLQLEELISKKKKVQAVQKEDHPAMAPVNTSVPIEVEDLPESSSGSNGQHHQKALQATRNVWSSSGTVLFEHPLWSLTMVMVCLPGSAFGISIGKLLGPHYSTTSRVMVLPPGAFGYIVALVLEVLRALIERGPMLSIEMASFTGHGWVLFEYPPLVSDYGCGLLVLDLPSSWRHHGHFGFQDLTTALQLGLWPYLQVKGPDPLQMVWANQQKVFKVLSQAWNQFIGAIAIGDLVKSTLGPKGMDKILLGGGKDSSVTVTNDGATILKAIGVDNPAAKVLVDMSKVQDDEVGDGTTSVTVLVAELLQECIMIDVYVIHPQIIITGWRKATQAACDALRDMGSEQSCCLSDELKFQVDLMNIARTTLSSKLLKHHKEHFAKLAVEAVLRLKGSGNLEAIHVIKKLGGSLTDSYLDEGFLLDKRIGVNQPKRIENANILIANTGMDTDKIKIFGSRVRVDSTAKVAEIVMAEKEKMKDKVERILKHGINCFINRQLIYNYPEQLFAAAGVMAIEHADFVGVERLALVTGGEITSTFDHPELVKIGHCKLIEEVMIGEDTLIHFSGVDMGECWRSAVSTNKPEGSLIFVFLPTIIADNAGYDSAELVSQLRATHQDNKSTFGLDMTQGTVGDMATLGITESFQVKRQVLLSTAEAAEMILRVNNIIKAAPRKRVPDHHPC